jgi:hypothetical protein
MLKPKEGQLRVLFLWQRSVSAESRAVHFFKMSQNAG